MRRISSFFRIDYHRKSLFFSLFKPICFGPGGGHMVSTAAAMTIRRRQKVVVVMGATGCGKSKLSVELATRFFPSEIINSDKMQVYQGLNITTNKIPTRERRNVPHHILGVYKPSDFHPEFTPSDFRSLAASTISAINYRRKLPLVVGGSNSFIYALAAKRFDPETDVFDESFAAVSKELRYNCCFLWVDVSLPVLNKYLSERVDEMLDSGMLDELAQYFKTEGFNDPESTATGLRKAIGVPEFDRYFKRFGCRTERTNPEEIAAYEEAVMAIKDNTIQLAKRQVWKMERLRQAGWDLWKVDATEALRAAMGSDFDGKVSEIWERQVVEPSAKIVKQFLEE